MSEIMDLYRQDEQRVLDRLVDGELSDAESRELLTALDRETGGWRRCALAFVEAQSLRGDLRGLRADSSRPVPSAARPAPFWLQQVPSRAAGLALAASLLVAVGLGLFVAKDRGLFRGLFESPSGTPLVVKDGLAPAGSGAGRSGSSSANADVWRTVKLNLDDALQGKRRDIELPVRDMASIDPHWGDADQSAISAEVLRALEQSGHEVRRERELWPIDLQDGRHVVVPVEQVEVRNISYQ